MLFMAPLQVQIFNTFFTVAGPPVLECVNPPPPIDTLQISIVDMNIGCDLIIKEGEAVYFLLITCLPDTSRPYDCVMTTPNGTNVLDINDGFDIAVQTSGDTVRSVFILQVTNPDWRPLGLDVLGVWTCKCNNSDGNAVAHTTLGCELADYLLRWIPIGKGYVQCSKCIYILYNHIYDVL